MAIAIFPGSFDPVTLGHIDIMVRAANMFNKRLIVGVGHNPEKQSMLESSDRVNLIAQSLGEVVDPSEYTFIIKSYEGLTIDFAREMNASVLVRGVRDGGDLKNELNISRINNRLAGLETIFLLPSDDHIMTSSSFVKQVWELGRDPLMLRNLVPESVVNWLKADTDR